MTFNATLFNEMYSKAYEKLAAENFDEAFDSFEAALNYVIHHKGERKEEYTIELHRCVVDILSTMAACKNSTAIIVPENPEGYIQSRAKLKIAIEKYEEALVWVKSIEATFTPEEFAKITNTLNNNLRNVQQNLASVHYNYGFIVCDKSVKSHSVTGKKTGIKYLAQALEVYQYLAENCSDNNELFDFYNKEANLTANEIDKKIDDFLTMLEECVDAIEISYDRRSQRSANKAEQKNVQSDNDKKRLEECIEGYKLVIELKTKNNQHTAESSDEDYFYLNEKIADIYNLLSESKDENYIEKAIEYYRISIDTDLHSLHPRNLKIHNSILRCYEDLLHSKASNQDKRQIAQKILTYISENELLNTGRLSAADLLEIYSYQFQALNVLENYISAVNFADKIVNLYNKIPTNDPLKKACLNDYRDAKRLLTLYDYQKQRDQEVEAESKRKLEGEENTPFQVIKRRPAKVVITQESDKESSDSADQDEQAKFSQAEKKRELESNSEEGVRANKKSIPEPEPAALNMSVFFPPIAPVSELSEPVPMSFVAIPATPLTVPTLPTISTQMARKDTSTGSNTEKAKTIKQTPALKSGLKKLKTDATEVKIMHVRFNSSPSKPSGKEFKMNKKWLSRSNLADLLISRNYFFSQTHSTDEVDSILEMDNTQLRIETEKNDFVWRGVSLPNGNYNVRMFPAALPAKCSELKVKNKARLEKQKLTSHQLAKIKHGYEALNASLAKFAERYAETSVNKLPDEYQSPYFQHRAVKEINRLHDADKLNLHAAQKKAVEIQKEVAADPDNQKLKFK